MGIGETARCARRVVDVRGLSRRSFPGHAPLLFLGKEYALADSLGIEDEVRHASKQNLGWSLTFLKDAATWHTRLTATRAADQLLATHGLRSDELYLRGEYAVAEKKAKWKAFINIEVNPQHVENYHNWGMSGDAISGLAEDLLAENYKLGLYYDAYSDKVTCSVTCNDPGSANGGYTFVATGPTWFDALAFALYKHFVVVEGEWPVETQGATGEYT